MNSNVKKADVYFNGQLVGRTPLNIEVNKKQGANIRVAKKGYTDVMVAMSTSLPVTFWGNIIFGGFTGSTVDFASGAIYEYSPNNFYKLTHFRVVSAEVIFSLRAMSL